MNIVVGASTVRYRDFVIGTLLGMAALVVGLAGFGYQVAEAFQDPKPRTLVNAAMFVLVPLTLARQMPLARFRRWLGPVGAVERAVMHGFGYVSGADGV